MTDAGGVSRSLTREVVVTEPEPGPEAFGADSFNRTVANGLGTADVGGPWTVSGTASNFSTSGGAGRIQAATGQTRAGYLTGAQSEDFDVTVDLSLNQGSTGGGAYVSVIGRRVSAGTDYRAKLRYQSNGSVLVYLTRSVGNAETTLAWTTVPGVTAAANDELTVRLQGSGSATTTSRVKVWRTGEAEPATWLVTNTSATPAALQAPGHLGVMMYLSSSWGGPTTTLSVDDLNAVQPE